MGITAVKGKELMNRPIEADYASYVAYTRALEEYCDSLAQPKQDPIAWRRSDKHKSCPNYEYEEGVFTSFCNDPSAQPLYASPPKRNWIGLMDEDMNDPKTHDFDFIHGARWAEAKLKARNT